MTQDKQEIFLIVGFKDMVIHAEDVWLDRIPISFMYYFLFIGHIKFFIIRTLGNLPAMHVMSMTGQM